MKYIYSILTALVLTFSSFEATSQVIMWTDSFTTGVPATAGQTATWNSFRAQLLSTYPYTKMTISGTFDSIGQVCTDTAIIMAYANALRNYTNYTSPLTNGNVWSLCARYDGEVWLNPPSQCSGANCPTGYIIRPGIGASNQNWGGVNTATCSGPTQRMTFTFEACVPGPAAAITAFTNDSVCLADPAITHSSGTPSGGTYSGTGVSGNTFNPTTAGIGTHYVVYSVTDSCNFTTMDSTVIEVESCVGINENKSLNNVSIYPNPTNGLVTVTLPTHNGTINYSVSSVEGKIVSSQNNVSLKNITIDLSDESKGIYLLKIEGDTSSKTYKIIKE